jgi:hypothetical protein
VEILVILNGKFIRVFLTHPSRGGMLARNMEPASRLNCTNNTNDNRTRITPMTGRWRTGQVQQPEPEQPG